MRCHLWVVFDHGQDAARIDKNVNQPSGAVQAPPHPVPRAPGALVERGEVVKLHAPELVHAVELLAGRDGLFGWRQERSGVRADLDELDRLIDVGLGRMQRALGDYEVQQPVANATRLGRPVEIVQIWLERVSHVEAGRPRCRAGRLP